MQTSSLRARRRTATVAVLLTAGLALTACGGSASDNASTNGGLFRSGVTIDAPSGPGSGYDQTARALEQAMSDEGIARRIEVKNTEGAGGTIALEQFMQKSGTGDLLIGGLSLVGATITNASDHTLSDLTPVARLIGEYEVIVVPADSEFETLEDFLGAMAEDPGGFPIAIGNQGGVDHMWGGTLVKAGGITPTDVNYVTFDGGGEVLVALLGGQVAAGISGYGEFAQQIEAGDLRVLAVSSEEPIEVAPDAPTIVDAGYPDAVLVNWRGVFAPPGLSDDDRQALSDAFGDLNDSEAWAEIREENGWSDEFLDSDEFTADLETQQSDTQSVLADLGLA